MMKRVTKCLLAASFLIWPMTSWSWEFGVGHVTRFNSDIENTTLNGGFGITLSAPAKNGEVEFQGMLSGDSWSNIQREVDRNVLFLYQGYLYLGDLYVNTNKEERYRIWELSLRYWHSLIEYVDIGTGVVLDIFEKNSDVKVSYPYPDNSFTLLNPHYQNLSNNEIYFTSGIPLGIRLRLPIKKNDDSDFAHIMVGAEYLFFENLDSDKITIQNKAVRSFGGPRLTLGFRLIF